MLAALIIVFREVVEAGLIVGIVLAATRGVPGRALAITGGVGGGVIGACLVAAFADGIANLFAGSGQELLNVAVLGIAVLMLGWHNIWMARHGRQMAAEMQAVGAAVRTGSRSLGTLAIVVGVAVLREGSEVVLFLYGVSASGGSSAAGIIGGGALGIALGGVVAALMYLGLVRIPARRLFAVTSGLIALLAAGMAAQAAQFLQQAGIVSALSRPLWDTSWVLADDSIGGRVLHTLVGYTDQPDGLQLLAYLATLAIIIGLMKLFGTTTPAHRPANGRPARA